MTSIDVTTIVPTFRREKEVVLAVESVLGQTGVSVECIVLDDSPEGSAKEGIVGIGDKRVKYVKRTSPSGGKPAIVRNEGVALASGKYLHFLDDDDLVASGAYVDMVAALDNAPNRGVAIGWVVPFGDDSEWLDDKSRYFAWAARRGATIPNSLLVVAHILFSGTLFVNSACMIRRELFDSLSGFDATIPVYEDVDFWMRAIRTYRHVYVQRPMLHYRIGRPSLMHNLGHDGQLVFESNSMIHQKYRTERGWLEYRALQLLSRALPHAMLSRISA